MDFDEAYPKRKIEEAERFIRGAWAGKEKIVYSAYPSEPVYRQVEDRDAMVENAVQNILAGAGLPGFNIPRFIADYGTVSTAAYWGGKKHTPVGGCIGIEPVFESAEDVPRARPSDPGGRDAQRAVDDWKAISARLGTDRLYCSLIDIQGPLNTAALLWKQDDFMVAMYTEPKTVHKLLEQVTDQIIAVIRNLLDRIGHVSGPLWPYIWLPKDIGIGITEDYMPLVSQKLYKEFGIPYVERISEAFGGLFIHCCGEYEHQFGNLVRSRINILGLEFSYPHVMPERLFEAFGSSVLFVPGLSPQCEAEFPRKLEFIRFLGERRLPGTRVWFILEPSENTFMEQVSVIEKMMD